MPACGFDRAGLACGVPCEFAEGGVSKITGFTILQQLKYGDKYVPACGIYVSGITEKVPMIMVELYLTREANDNDLDRLRVALKSWAKLCGFGELKETGVE